MRRVHQEDPNGILLVIEDQRKFRIKFLNNYDTRKYKAYMRVGLVLPREVSIDTMFSRLKIMGNYVNSFPYQKIGHFLKKND